MFLRRIKEPKKLLDKQKTVGFQYETILLWKKAIFERWEAAKISLIGTEREIPSIYRNLMPKNCYLKKALRKMILPGISRISLLSTPIREVSDRARAYKGIVECHYVDDYIDSFDTVSEAIAVAGRVVDIHARAGFEINCNENI